MIKGLFYSFMVFTCVFIGCNKKSDTSNDDDTSDDSDSLSHTDDTVTSGTTDSMDSELPELSSDSSDSDSDEAPLCESGQAYCNGSCFIAAGDHDENCRALAVFGDSQATAVQADSAAAYFMLFQGDLYRIDLESLSKELILADLTFPDDLLLSGNTLFSGTDDGSGDSGLISVQVDGNDFSALTQTGDGADHIQTDGTYVYYLGRMFTDSTLTRVSLTELTTDEPLPEEIGFFRIWGDYLYFSYDWFDSHEEGIGRAPLNDLGSVEKILENEPVLDFFIERGVLYWLNRSTTDSSLNSYALDTGIHTVVAESDDWTYVANTSTHLIYRSRLATDERIDEIRMIPLTGGDSITLGTVAFDEVSDAEVVGSTLYVAVGYRHAAALLEIEL